MFYLCFLLPPHFSIPPYASFASSSSFILPPPHSCLLTFPHVISFFLIPPQFASLYLCITPGHHSCLVTVLIRPSSSSYLLILPHFPYPCLLLTHFTSFAPCLYLLPHFTFSCFIFCFLDLSEIMSKHTFCLLRIYSVPSTVTIPCQTHAKFQFDIPSVL